MIHRLEYSQYSSPQGPRSTSTGITSILLAFAVMVLVICLPVQPGPSCTFMPSSAHECRCSQDLPQLTGLLQSVHGSALTQSGFHPVALSQRQRFFLSKSFTVVCQYEVQKSASLKFKTQKYELIYRACRSFICFDAIPHPTQLSSCLSFFKFWPKGGVTSPYPGHI